MTERHIPVTILVNGINCMVALFVMGFVYCEITQEPIYTAEGVLTNLIIQFKCYSNSVKQF